LGLAVIFENFGMVEFLVEHGADIEKRNGNTESSAFLLAVNKANLDILSYLVKSDADINATTKSRDIALDLYKSISYQSKEIINYLEELQKPRSEKVQVPAPNAKEAPVKKWFNLQKTKEIEALLSAKEISWEKVKSLIESGANPDAKNDKKWTALDLAAYCGKLEVVKFLVEHGANIDAKNTDSEWPTFFSLHTERIWRY
jgi:ankyrin repeat protein